MTDDEAQLPTQGLYMLGPFGTLKDLHRAILRTLNEERLHVSRVSVSYAHAILPLGYLPSGELFGANAYFSALVTWWR